MRCFNLTEMLSIRSHVVHQLSMESWAAAKKKHLVSMVVPLAPVQVPSQRTLVPRVVSVANVKDDNEIILGAVYRSPGICLTAKPQLRDMVKGLCDQSSPPQMGFLSSKCRSIRRHTNKSMCLLPTCKCLCEVSHLSCAELLK
jgi:hypothetical protein